MSGTQTAGSQRVCAAAHKLRPVRLASAVQMHQPCCFSAGEEQIFLLTEGREAGKGGAHTLAFRNPSPGFSKDL